MYVTALVWLSPLTSIIFYASNRWGPRVQKGYRVSGVRRPGEKKPN